MAITPVNTIKSWFVSKAKPTQAQFWAVFDSFRHKSEKVPVADIEGLTNILKPFNDHLNDPNAHAGLLAKTKIYASGELQVFKIPTNVNVAALEIGDLVFGIVSGQFIKGIYLGGDITVLESFTILSQEDLPIIEP